MKKIFYLSLILITYQFSFAQLIQNPKEEELKGFANDFIKNFKENNFEVIYQNSDETVQQKLTTSKLAQIKEQLDKQVGALINVDKFMFDQKDNYDIVIVTCSFEKMKLDIRLVYNSNKKIAGLFFVPSQQNFVKYKSPEYVDTSSFREINVKIGAGTKWELPAILTLPKLVKSCPVLILVHGSGPNDSDETVGGAKPFKDLAWGLASQGIAVLRYQKRTKEHAMEMYENSKNITINEETVDDAVEAIKTVIEIPEIDSMKIFFLGHSLGGFIMPRIVGRTPEAKGYIIMAGLARRLEDTFIDQMKYLISLDSNKPVDSQKYIDSLSRLRDIIKKGTYDKDTSSSDLFMGVPASYWKDLQNYNPSEEIKKYNKPILIVQGKRDYQVTTVDFNMWKQALKAHKNCKFILYPDLNHLFVYGVGKSKPQEYYEEGHVSDELIKDISAWIKSFSK